MPADDTVRDRDLVLAPNEQAAILDETKGNVSVYVGPTKASLGNNDRPVIFDPRAQRYTRVSLEAAITPWPFAPEGHYVVLENPAVSGQEAHPREGVANSSVRLDHGRRLNLHGPTTFPLWPGQVAEVIEGHRLRSNEYLIIVVYNDEAARDNWGQAVLKGRAASTQEPPQSGGEDNTAAETPAQSGAVVRSGEEVPDLTMGQRLIVRGTEVSFYMPPTGITVLKDESDQYVRSAVTLERLEYCILIGEDGEKRYVQGPAVVFPRPEETFVEEGNNRKFRAIELSPISGLYIKVIADYEEDGKGRARIQRRVGDELFITGKDQPIYYPRPEHAIIKYDTQQVHHAVAIPEGEARYVLDRNAGKVSLVHGPKMFLPDPRNEVIVKRILSDREVELWFPGNQEALAYNRQLAQLSQTQRGREVVSPRDPGEEATLAVASAATRTRGGPQRFAGDELRRGTEYTQPRTLVLNTKYEGAVSIDVWPGYAVLIVSKSGGRRVVLGPRTVMLEYDETLMVLELSTGTPKSDDHLIKVPFLLVHNNRVSDKILVETADLCPIEITLSYRVNFEGEGQEEWFAVSNYVKLLTEHMRSLIRGVVKQHGIERFYAESIPIIRDAILGKSVRGRRTGRLFAENLMRIYDAEVLDVQIYDNTISRLLIEAQHQVVQRTLAIGEEERNQDLTRRSEAVKQAVAVLRAETASKQRRLQLAEVEETARVQLAQIAVEGAVAGRSLEVKLAGEEGLNQVNALQLTRERQVTEQELVFHKERVGIALQQLEAEVKAVVAKAAAVSPDFIAALQAFGDKDLMAKLAEAMGPLAIIDRTSVAHTIQALFQGMPIADVVGQIGQRNTNDRAVAAGYTRSVPEE